MGGLCKNDFVFLTVASFPNQSQRYRKNTKYSTKDHSKQNRHMVCKGILSKTQTEEVVFAFLDSRIFNWELKDGGLKWK